MGLDAQAFDPSTAELPPRDDVVVHDELAERWHSEYWKERGKREDAEREVRLLKVELREVQDAAQTYHEAWQDACVYWKDKLAEARDVARHLMEIGVWPRLQAVFMKRHPWLDEE